MLEPPRSVKERLFTKKVLLRSVYIGVIIAIGALIGCFNAWAAAGWHFGDPVPIDWHFNGASPNNNPDYLKGVTMFFAGIVVAQAGNVLASRTSKQSIFKTSLKTNKWIIVGIAAQLAILALLIYVPLMNQFFGTVPLDLVDWGYLFSLAVVVVVAEEIRKFFSRKLTKTATQAAHTETQKV
jgi:sodium/potassium-transporting ATPase subunit alpha